MKNKQLIILAAFAAFALVAGATIRAARVQVTAPPPRIDPITVTPTETPTTTTETPPANPVVVPGRPQVISPYR